MSKLKRVLKTHWFYLALLATSIVTVFAINPLMLWAYYTFYVNPTLAEVPEYLRPWIPVPFEATWYNTTGPTIVYIVLSILWASAGLIQMLQKHRKLLLVVAIVGSIVLATPPVAEILAYGAYRMFYYDLAMSSIPVPVRPYADPVWFHHTTYSQIPFTLRIVIIGLWTTLGIYWVTLRRKLQNKAKMGLD